MKLCGPLRHKRPPKQMLDFREVLSFCDLHDLGFSGLPWTYDNKQSRDQNVRVRLDRVVASPSWMNWFLDAKPRHLVSVSSDHYPVFLDLDQVNEPRKENKVMRYEIMWEREESLPREIKKAWEGGVHAQDLGDVALNLCRMMKSLRRWSFDKFGAVTKEIDNIQRKVEEHSGQNHVQNQVEIVRLRTHMEELLYRDEMMRLQRSCITWLKEGDRNTKFFHRKAA
jgi:hypothetical protein